MSGVIWYNGSKQSAVDKAESVIQDYKDLGIEVKSKKDPLYGDTMILFANGDFWRTARAIDASRGIKSNIAYVQADIEDEIFNTIIRPTIEGQKPFSGYRFY